MIEASPADAVSSDSHQSRQSSRRDQIKLTRKYSRLPRDHDMVIEPLVIGVPCYQLFLGRRSPEADKYIQLTPVEYLTCVHKK